MKRRDPLHDPRSLIRRVYGYAAYRLGTGAEADDVTAQTMERAVRYRRSFDPDKGDPAEWIIGIARRCVEDALAARSLDARSPDEAADYELEADVLRRLTVTEALAILSDRDRELISLRYGSDLSARQIALLLGMRTNAVEVALHRALSRLRPLLDESDL